MIRYWRFKGWALFFVLLALPGLACGLVSGEEQVTAVVPLEGEGEEEIVPTETPVPTTVPTVTPEPVVEAPELGDLSDLGAALDALSSYRLTVEMMVTGAGAGRPDGGFRVETAVTGEPPASSTTISVQGQMVEEAGGMDSLSIAEVGDQVFMVLPGMGCVAGSEEEMGGTSEQFADLFDSGDLLGDIEGADFVGEDSVNGVDVYHYRFDENDVDNADSNIRELVGDVYVAQAGGYVVRMVIDGVGQMDLLDEGTDEERDVHLEYNVTDVDAEFEIQIPEGCEESGFPLMEDATNQASFGGLTSYETAASVEEVVAFYEEEMSALGYEAGDDQFITEDTAILTFVQQSMPEISVTVNRDGETTSVLISSEPDGG